MNLPELQQLCCEQFGISQTDINKSAQDRNISNCKHLYRYVAIRHFGAYDEILKQTSTSSIQNSIDAHRRLRKNNSDYAKKVELVLQMIK